MNIIAAVSKNWGIGKDNKLLFHIPADMKFFRNTTLNKVVVMGRKTLESFPGKKPLGNRINIVLSRNSEYKPENVIVCNSKKELFGEINKYNTDDIYICGGEQIYRLLLPYCEKAYITKVEAEAEADSFMPDFDKDFDWELTESSEIMEDNGYSFSFNLYKRCGDISC